MRGMLFWGSHGGGNDHVRPSVLRVQTPPLYRPPLTLSALFGLHAAQVRTQPPPPLKQTNAQHQSYEIAYNAYTDYSQIQLFDGMSTNTTFFVGVVFSIASLSFFSLKAWKVSGCFASTAWRCALKG